MAHLYIIAGHGAGDSGACGNGYQEAERVRALAQRIKDFGGDNVTLHPFSDNAYASGAINYLDIPSDWCILELHMDSYNGSAHGGHVIIPANYGGADNWDKAIAQMMVEIFPGRANSIVERSDLANPNRAMNRGYNYRLVENGFIDNVNDITVFNARLDEIAKRYAEIFAEGEVETPAPAPEATPEPEPAPAAPSTDIDDLARRVINGEFGNGDARKKALGSNYDAVQARVNEMLGGSYSAPAVDISALADVVINGEYGNGEERKRRLGSNYEAVQAEVNRRLGY